MPSLFLALFPPLEIAAQIAAAATTWPQLVGHADRCITPERLHVTLAYLGDRGHDERCIAAVRGVLERFGGVPVDTEFGVLRAFGDAGARPIVLTGDYINPFVSELRAQLVPDLERAGVRVDVTHDFVPHITLAYADVDLQATSVGPFCFRASEIALVRGGDYSVLARRALVAPPDRGFFAWFRDPSAPGRDRTPEELEELRSWFRP